jgi:sulfate adenylyltransferase subunit 1 (EFTu-like GTPase family)
MDQVEYSETDFANRRFPVQYVVLPLREEFHDYRGYAGRIAGGVWKSGDKVAVLPGGIIKELKFKMNINNLEENLEDKTVALNEIARISIKTSKPIFYDSYKDNHITGSIIIIDEASNNTMGAGMII